ncbi:MAG: histidine kinase, partial [Ferruginibacter sp.]
MKTKFIFLLHIGFWLCYLFIFIILLAVLNPNENDYTKISGYLKTFLGFALVPCAVSFYGFYLYVFPNYIKTKSILKTIGNGILISMASAIIGFIVMFFIVDEPCTKPIGSAITIILAMFFFMSFIAFIEGFVGFVIRGFIAWYSDIKVKEALLIKTHQTELALLKSQLDPHFLFNTLNNIDVLILKNPNIASEYLNKLSGIMRFMLYETKEEVIPLSKEIEYIKKYI